MSLTELLCLVRYEPPRVHMLPATTAVRLRERVSYFSKLVTSKSYSMHEAFGVIYDLRCLP